MYQVTEIDTKDRDEEPCFLWANATHLLASNKSDALDVYTHASGVMTYVGTIAVNSKAACIFGDYIITTSGTAALAAYNLSTLAFIANIAVGGLSTCTIEVSATHIFVSSLNFGLVALTFNGTAFTKIADSYADCGVVSTYCVLRINDQTFVVAEVSPRNMTVLTWSGSAFAKASTVGCGGGNATKALATDGEYIYATGVTSDQLLAYSLAGTTIGYLTSYQLETSMSDVAGVYANSDAIVTGDRLGVYVLTFDGSAFTLECSVVVYPMYDNGIAGSGSYAFVGTFNPDLTSYLIENLYISATPSIGNMVRLSEDRMVVLAKRAPSGEDSELLVSDFLCRKDGGSTVYDDILIEP